MEAVNNIDFAHLHVHTEFSLLDGAARHLPKETQDQVSADKARRAGDQDCFVA